MDDEKDTKVRFETLSAEKIPFGKNNFLEVARKKAITEEGDSEFISVSEVTTYLMKARNTRSR